MSTRHWGVATRSALLLALAALVGDALVVRRALAPSLPVRPTATPTVAIPDLDTLPNDAPGTEAERSPPDPFDADRRSNRPSDRRAESPAVADSSAVLRLVGTVIVPGRVAVAVCQTPGQPPRTVHLGERLGGLTLVAVEQAHAVFRSPDGRRVTLDIPKPGS